jgi:putative intracellular protease/amidase
MHVAILLYDGVTALDAIGPYEVLQSPGLDIDVRVVAREKGLKRTDFGRLGLMADYPLDKTPRPDILVVPGTAYPQAVMGDQQVLEWIAQVYKTTNWTTSVCTRSIGPWSRRRVLRDRHGASPRCRRVRSRYGANGPTPYRVRSAATVRCRQPRQGAAAGCECSARVVCQAQSETKGLAPLHDPRISTTTSQEEASPWEFNHYRIGL